MKGKTLYWHRKSNFTTYYYKNLFK